MIGNDDKSHFYKFYFPLILRWGNVPHQCGEVHSCQGLEKDWDWDKREVSAERKNFSRSDLELRHIFGGISNRFVYFFNYIND